MKIVIVGLGGVGSALSAMISRYVNYLSKSTIESITLVDGDTYEPKNEERQDFDALGNKAEVKAQQLSTQFPRVKFLVSKEFIDTKNVGKLIGEKTIVFLCVDNHKTRKIVSEHCSTLQNIVVISGGNELTDGNVQTFIRKGGADLTPSLLTYHPEIANPIDKLPSEMSCEELASSSPQLYFANLGVAVFMCWAFYNVMNSKKPITKSEIYFDLVTLSYDAKTRVVN